MGILDRMRAAQEKAQRRNQRVAVIGATALDVADQLGHLVRVLRGTCPNCGTVNDVRVEGATTTVQTTCVSCATAITMHA